MARHYTITEAVTEGHKRRIETAKAKYGDDYFKVITAKGRANREYKKGVTLNTGRTHFKKGTASFNKGKPLSEHHKQSLRGKRPNFIPWNKGQHQPRKERDHTERVHLDRTCKLQVFRRANFTCQICDQYSGYLQVDHIKSWANYPELRFELSNCRTLCMACHYYV